MLKKELLARGVTHIFFQANIWVFTVLSLILGAVMGIGKAAVYKHIPDYFPNDVGVVGGIVGVLGGLGGFVCPVIFRLPAAIDTGLWTSCWMFFAVVVAILPDMDAPRHSKNDEGRGAGTSPNPH